MENCYASARQAGEAFKHRVESDKDLQSRLNRWSERLAKIGEALHEATPEMERIRAEWRHDFGVDLPENLDDLVRLATRAGVGFERIRAARPDALMPVIEGYLQRLSDQREQRTSGTRKKPANTDALILAIIGKNPDAVGWSAAKLAEAIGRAAGTVKETSAWKYVQKLRADERERRRGPSGRKH